VSPAQPDRALVLRIEPPGHRCPVVSTLSGADRWRLRPGHNPGLRASLAFHAPAGVV